MELPILTVREEGGLFEANRDPSRPIRIYKDRRVQDDIAARYTGKKWRERLSRRDFRLAKKHAYGKV